MPWLSAPEQVRAIPISGWRVTDGSRQLWSGVRVGSWTYARLHTGQVEVYDRSSDPYEQHNLAADPSVAETVKALARLADPPSGLRRLDLPEGPVRLGPGARSGGAVTRVGDLEREAARARLVEAYAAGRIDAPELESRAEAVWDAARSSDLAAVVDDLGEDPAPPRGAGPVSYAICWCS
jgi:hypothetical protein